ncbi:uncharacterized protein MONOS_7376 [Monocercomonoides exilis]|uniref:uncharacterized protein n=1 Tax=Monocercomonoides exilis TaxID=2049356 RepID=UPI00355A4F28|nr:hypothetical protein MONOS_7376 [Monocercomonoides exilis]|eukprot:MONOS_7376.1-p1 / transcript=MONOS_7376.1 / gene=MONOS_7376 / organism=Monocercomonoides_exilis_PA203 / gene_product=unspecified product / transcript_product=unspecified product / location=Mono_scaffold00250:45435-46894(+) / protein_length=446 / sequence_SO=supercontig / SO=protein_coding / is_pseudo=false
MLLCIYILDEKDFSKRQKISARAKLNELFSQLEDCDDEEQAHIIEELYEIMEEMDKKVLRYVFTGKLCDKVYRMIEEKKRSMENAILLLKRLGYFCAVKNVQMVYFGKASLSNSFEKLIIEENEKKEGKNERLLVDLCECFALLFFCSNSDELLSIIMPCLLKVALNKEEDEETKKEVEIALLALSCVSSLRQELYFNEMREIIQHHQEHHNLTRLAYQSAWKFLMNRFYRDKSLEDVIANELHFVRETTRELEELAKYVDWKRKDGDEREKETMEELILRRWILAIYYYFSFSKCRLWNEEFIGLFSNIAQLLRAAKDHYREICKLCIVTFTKVAGNVSAMIDYLLKGGAVDAILEEIQQSTVDDQISFDCLEFFYAFSSRLKIKVFDERKEAKRREMKRKIFEKMEEEGCEDIITSFCEILDFLKGKYNRQLSLDISDYLVNV